MHFNGMCSLTIICSLTSCGVCNGDNEQYNCTKNVILSLECVLLIGAVYATETTPCAKAARSSMTAPKTTTAASAPMSRAKTWQLFFKSPLFSACR